jgi:hypothetical protein
MDLEGALDPSLVLGGDLKVRTRRSVRLDNSLREQVIHFLSGGWSVGSENVVEGAVLANDHDHVLNRSCRGGALSGFGSQARGSYQVRDGRQQSRAKPKIAAGRAKEISTLHSISSGWGVSINTFPNTTQGCHRARYISMTWM